MDCGIQVRPHPGRREDDYMEIPKFLDRREFVTIACVDGEPPRTFLVTSRHSDLYIDGGPRKWAPMKSISEIRRREFSAERRAQKIAQSLYVSNEANPVQVVTTQKVNLQLHDNLAAFERNHDMEDYPVVKMVEASGITYAIVKQERRVEIDVPIVKTDVMERNGIKRPTRGLTAQAWAKYDDVHSKGGSFDEAIAELVAAGMNSSTARVQFSHWKKFVGVNK